MADLPASSGTESDSGVGLAPEAQDRLRGAMVDLVLAGGYPALTIEDLCRAAAISPEQFAAEFTDLEAAYIWVHKRDAAELKAAIATAFEAEAEWRESLRAAAYAAAHWIEAHPREMRFGMVEMLGAGELAQAEREAELNWMIDVIDTGRSQLADPESRDRSWALGAMGAIYSKLTAEIQHDEDELRVVGFAPECLYLAMLPYIGQEAAEEELRRGPEDLERYRRGQL